MKNYFFYLLVFFLSLHNADAQWWSLGEKVEGNGKVISDTRDLPQYDKISVSGSFDVELVSGREGDITIEAESNLHKHIITEVSEGVLKIKTEDRISLEPTEKIKITVPFEDIDEVSLSGSGEIISADRISSRNFELSLSGSGKIALHLEVQKIEAALSGSGKVDLSGSAGDFDMAVSGSGDVEATGLKAENVSAAVSGSGDIAVFASESLEAAVSGSGDITYQGDPQRQDFHTSGSGSVSKN